MSFSRANGSGWAVGAVLTSAQLNAIDVDHANALDKTSAGDTVAGTVNFSGSGKVSANIAGSVVGATAGGIQSGVVGGLQLSGGSTDWPAFSANRSRVIAVPFDVAPLVITAAATSGGNTGTYAPGTSNWNPAQGLVTTVVNSGSANVYSYLVPLRQLHNGATMTSASIYLTGAGAHGALPAVMPAFGILRFQVSNPASGWSSLNSGGTSSQDPTAVLATYKALHSWSFTCNQNNVIDTTQYTYFAVIWDEANTNALGGNQYAGLALAFTAIADMRFA